MVMLEFVERDGSLRFDMDEFMGMILMGFGSRLYPSYVFSVKQKN